jgi:hypothetical protein
MKFDPLDPPRKFRVGRDGQIEMSDCGRVCLAADEQVTFLTPSGKEHDFGAKRWGFYATPSVNGRLKEQGFKTALVRNAQGRLYIMVVDTDRLEEFHDYINAEQQTVCAWLDEH